MNKMTAHKYSPFKPIPLPDRQWPSRLITQAPQWCSVDLRDGNQALIIPMSVEDKLAMFRLLVEIGFREIEVGFPAASQTDFDFVSRLISEGLVPDDVTIQVLTQARQPLIKKTFEALKGVNRAIVHLYNSTSELQRRVVFKMGRDEIIGLAKKGAEVIKDEAEKMERSDIVYEYSPESFTGTEPDFAIEICSAVMDVWRPSPSKRVILNLPSTVEMATPNVYADQIEWFIRNISNRDSVIISCHAHNDRGTAVAATELALMAGAERVEGTLFGNGERTGNADIVTIAMNMFSQGMDPGLDFSNMPKVVGVYEHCTRIPVHVRQPYAGELVYTAFSGSHQDAINKGMKTCLEAAGKWEVPYLPIDPADVGRTYESVIRINSQSGKGGVAYIMEKDYGLRLPREMHAELGAVVQDISDRSGEEVLPHLIKEAFDREFITQNGPLRFLDCTVREDMTEDEASVSKVAARVEDRGAVKNISGSGNGPIDAFSNALRVGLDADFRLVSYHEHALAEGSDSKAVAYIRIEDKKGKHFFGAGIDTNIDLASFRALISALNRSNLS